MGATLATGRTSERFQIDELSRAHDQTGAGDKSHILPERHLTDEHQWWDTDGQKAEHHGRDHHAPVFFPPDAAHDEDHRGAGEDAAERSKMAE
jgi:hypothetical protein